MISVFDINYKNVRVALTMKEMTERPPPLDLQSRVAWLQRNAADSEKIHGIGTPWRIHEHIIRPSNDPWSALVSGCKITKPASSKHVQKVQVSLMSGNTQTAEVS